MKVEGGGERAPPEQDPATSHLGNTQPPPRLLAFRL